MLKLRTILLSKKLYYLIFLTALIYTIIYLSIPKTSSFSENTNQIEGKITSLIIVDDTLKITLKAKESFLLTYYFKENKEKITFQETYHLNDKIFVTGTFSHPKQNTTKYLFNYKKYLERKNIFYLVKVKSITKVSSNKNIYYFFKDHMIKSLSENAYLLTFIYGNKAYIKKAVLKSYQTNGISHLFAISGMHISLLSSIILRILKHLKIEENKRYYFTMLFLLLYLSFVGLSPSILRGVLFFILFSLNKIHYFYIKPFHLFLVVLSFSLFLNPYYIYDVGFLYSFTISLSLILTSKYLQGNYLTSLIKVSCISFLISIPITLYNFYTLNLLSIIYNLFYVPYVSFIIFPLSLLTSILKPLLPVYNFLIDLLETTSLFLAKIDFLTFTFKRVDFIFYLFYYPLIILFIYSLTKKKTYFSIFLILAILTHYFFPNFLKETYIEVLDVGQGDSLLIHSNNSTVLLDTGGSSNSNYSIVENSTIPHLKAQGIKKLNFLIISHGDFDHMGEALNLINSFKVECVIFNNGDYNELELELISLLEKKNIPYYKNVTEINIGDNKLYFLDTTLYDNENDNSNVVYFYQNNFKFLFMGDAGIKKEKDILAKYDLNDIDFLKVGHHGSNTSSSKPFINSINPKYALISVGENNRYNHPQKSVLDNLSNSKVYRTDLDGSIEIKLNKNGYKIRTYEP